MVRWVADKQGTTGIYSGTEMSLIRLHGLASAEARTAGHKLVVPRCCRLPRHQTPGPKSPQETRAGWVVYSCPVHALFAAAEVWALPSLGGGPCRWMVPLLLQEGLPGFACAGNVNQAPAEGAGEAARLCSLDLPFLLWREQADFLENSLSWSESRGAPQP